MAYDGIFIKKQIEEIKNIILGEHISKIQEKSPKRIDFYFRKDNKNYVLSLDANPNFPHMLLDDTEDTYYGNPPAFCMLLRKYLRSGILKSIRQVSSNTLLSGSSDSYERIVELCIDNIDESGDQSTYYVFFEIMGKYSNIIITDHNLQIIDCLIKSNNDNIRLNPKNTYTLKSITQKKELFSESDDAFIEAINKSKSLANLNSEDFDLANEICKNYAGISKPYIISAIIDFCNEHRTTSKNNSDLDLNYSLINNIITCDNDLIALLYILKNKLNSISSPCINYKNEKPSDLYIYKLNQYVGTIKYFKTLNSTVKAFVDEKYTDITDHVEKKVLKETLSKLYNRLNKKLDIYENDLKKCKDAEKYKNYAVLISTYGYNKDMISDGVLHCDDYNNDYAKVNIPIDVNLTIAKNIEAYYNKYNKMKRTKENAEIMIDTMHDKIEHLNSISKSIDINNEKNDLFLIREELIKYFDEVKSMKLLKNSSALSQRTNSKSNYKKLQYNIHHFKSSDGTDIYLGKNNLQNEYLTFTLAQPNDTWLHIKNATGSHVIIKKPYEKLSDTTLIEAASLAAYYSSMKNEAKTTVDYTLRKELKKVKGKAPGFCIYHKYYSINVKPEMLIKEI